ncbi:Pls/PosA family non-ribosomal peptide synthetase [Streptomyces sp. NPDC046866]|uniref:Pls/PosA family non-ribosomal peptide synthetase n=1 Tax=Streptomyces sp. NPDC046866 TaxID=3154921 RepID=UPI0034514924
MTEKQISAVRPPAEEAPDREAAGPPRSSTAVEEAFTRLLADVTHVHPVSVHAHFFDELGADSLVMAHFCALVRKHGGLPPVSIKDVYRHPTVSSLVTAVAGVNEGAAGEAAPLPSPAPSRPAARGAPHHVLCGVLQLLAFLVYSCLVVLAATRGYAWAAAGSGLGEQYLRAVVFGAAAFAVLCVFPVVAKWVLVGRWKPVRLRVWSLPYVRFWIVRTLIRSDPLVVFVGSPLYVLYLRALGAKIGRGVTVFSRIVPVCTDLLTLGDGALIRKDAYFPCYRAHDGLIETGPVSLGKDAVVGEASVLDLGTWLGDGAQLGHASALHSGQGIPAGEHWHGSPAQRTGTDFLAVAPARCGTARRVLHGVVQILAALLVYLPFSAAAVSFLLAHSPQLAATVAPGPAAIADWPFYAEALAATALVFFGGLALTLLTVTTLPRLLDRALTPDRVYPLYGFHFGVYRAITLLTNRRFLTRLFGDSSAIVHYLGALGYRLRPVEQTGSNFGTEVRHDSPYLASVGSGTMVADGLSINNADFSSTSFRVHRVSIGPRNFLGNRIAYPSRGRTGDNCLLATKVMVPVDGEIRQGVGLLGSPSFEIPRSVSRDGAVDPPDGGRPHGAAATLRLLPAKNRHNAVTMAWYLAVRWIHFFVLTLILTVAAEAYGVFGPLAVAAGNLCVVVFSIAYLVLIERAVTARHPTVPLFCSIYDPRFWERERFWKVPSEGYLRLFNGTPFKPLVWRLLGVRIGRRVFDDGCHLTERTMVAIGDECTLNAGSIVQCHSQEDGAFKSDRTAIGARCTIGVGALVHYGVTVGDGAVLAPDSFLMKGTTVPQGEVWGGNPARRLHGTAPGPRRGEP